MVDFLVKITTQANSKNLKESVSFKLKIKLYPCNQKTYWEQT